jgi:propionate CoA-transferase
MAKSKLITPEEAAALIPDGVTLASAGVGIAWPEEIAIAMRDRFLATGQPRQLTFVNSGGLGNVKDRGLQHFAHDGMVKAWIGSHIGNSPTFAKMVTDNKIEGYCLPQGTIAQLYREIAAHRPGLVSKVGLKTFVDPRLEGGRLNTISHDERVKLIQFEGGEYLFYPAFPIQVAILRGSVADENGNVTVDREGVFMEVLAVAQAVKNSGGIVIVQVERVVKAGTLHPKSVKIPGVLVDHLVIGKPENHIQTMTTYYEPAFSGEVKIPTGSMPRLPFDVRCFVARRCAMELIPGAIVNVGIGMPDGIPSVAAEEGVADMMTLTTELGNIGGVPATGPDFAHAYNPEATVEHPSQFAWYEGGGLDIAFLGLAQADQHGNVNVSKFKGRAMGCGGFINITQNAKKVVFAGTFTAGGLKVMAEGGKLVIIEEGSGQKLLDEVEQVTFSGAYAIETKQPVLFITERAVFTLEEGQMTLIEIAPGIDLEKDIIGQMGFRPRISPNLKLMPAEIFQPKWGGLRRILEAK